MKKLLSLATLALVAVSLTSCGFLNYVGTALATNPEFQVKGDGSNEGIYNGQTYRVTKTATCNYAWESADPSILVLKTSGNDAYVTGKLTNAEKSYTSKLTARNADDATITPVSHEVIINAWTLKVYDAAGNLVSNATQLARSNTYVIKMVKIGGSAANPSYTPVPKLLGGIKLSAGEENIALSYSLSSSAYSKVSSTDLTLTIKTPAKAASCTVTAKLGDVSQKLSIATK